MNKKIKPILAAIMLAVLVTGTFAGSSINRKYHGKRYSTDVLNLYAYNGSSYTELVSSGVLDDGFTVTKPSGPSWPSAITDASGYPCLLMTYSGTKYYALYSTSEW